MSGGQVATSLHEVAAMLGWDPRTVPDTDTDAGAALAALAALGRGDAVVVLSHDIDLSGRVLARALTGGADYVGALGSRGTPASRRYWLVEHGVDDETVDRTRDPERASTPLPREFLDRAGVP